MTDFVSVLPRRKGDKNGHWNSTKEIMMTKASNIVRRFVMMAAAVITSLNIKVALAGPRMERLKQLGRDARDAGRKSKSFSDHRSQFLDEVSWVDLIGRGFEHRLFIILIMGAFYFWRTRDWKDSGGKHWANLFTSYLVGCILGLIYEMCRSSQSEAAIVGSQLALVLAFFAFLFCALWFHRLAFSRFFVAVIKKGKAGFVYYVRRRKLPPSITGEAEEEPTELEEDQEQEDEEDVEAEEIDADTEENEDEAEEAEDEEEDEESEAPVSEPIPGLTRPFSPSLVEAFLSYCPHCKRAVKSDDRFCGVCFGQLICCKRVKADADFCVICRAPLKMPKKVEPTTSEATRIRIRPQPPEVTWGRPCQ